MRRLIISIILFSGSFDNSSAQSSYEKIVASVLTKNNISKSYSFDLSRNGDFNKLELKFLGSLKTKKSFHYKILTQKRTWGPNKHTTGVIFIFNKKDKYIGQYTLGGATDLPDKMVNGKLIFTNNDNRECDKSLLTTVNLKNGLPKNIFIKCRGEFGDLYSFSSNN